MCVSTSKQANTHRHNIYVYKSISFRENLTFSLVSNASLWHQLRIPDSLISDHRQVCLKLTITFLLVFNKYKRKSKTFPLLVTRREIQRYNVGKKKKQQQKKSNFFFSPFFYFVRKGSNKEWQVSIQKISSDHS